MKHTSELLEIMARLRDPDGGCPWDVEQDFSTIAPYTIEEAYEVADAIERENYDDLRDELGDLLLQVVFHAQMARERELFDFEAVAAGICDKLVRRHPHVFGDATIEDAEAQVAAWEASKAAERAERAGGLLDDVPRGLPALSRAAKLSKRAASVGFDWPAIGGARAKVDEELAEFDEALAQGAAERVEEEFGDLLFALVNLARHAGAEPENALQAACVKFTRRFARIEAALAEAGSSVHEADLDTMDRLWNQAKRRSP
ncbi:MAG: nucleoside triphosphate pyrophosphohydrolase [Pseudomonadota bacterium]